MKKMVLIIITMALLAGLFSASASAQSVEEIVISSGDIEINTAVYNYKEKGGEAILFLPGLGGSCAHAEFLFHPHNPYMTVTLDYPNHGNSGETAFISWEILLDAVKAVADHYKLKKINLVGHSFGADVAMMFASAYPKLVNDVILIDRAYYNYADMEQFNFKRNLVELLEYNPQSGLSYEAFLQYLDLAYSNDIRETWGLKKKVLLIAADPSIYLTLPDLIAAIKANPEYFGLPPELAYSLPNVSAEDALALHDYLLESAAAFDEVHNRFDVLYTPYPHAMILMPDLQEEIRDYVLGFLKNRLNNLL